MYLFEAQEITKQYASHLALDHVSIAIKEQSIFGLLGPNGAGKTSLIRIITQITAPDKGRLFFNGEPLGPQHISYIGYLPEERGLYKKMKVGEQAIYLAQLKGLSKQEAITQLKYWFIKFEIEAWWDKKVEELSKGMQQKIQFITTILHKPKLLIFDEPFSGFDPINANLLKEEILNLKEEGCTIIFSTHNMESVEEICDDIALIHQSKKILEGSVVNIKNAFKKNHFELILSQISTSLDSILPSTAYIMKEQIKEGTHTIHLKTDKDFSSNQLLSTLLPYANIHSFNEILPSMNEIFIESVQANGNVNKIMI